MTDEVRMNSAKSEIAPEQLHEGAGSDDCESPVQPVVASNQQDDDNNKDLKPQMDFVKRKICLFAGPEIDDLCDASVHKHIEEFVKDEDKDVLFVYWIDAADDDEHAIFGKKLGASFDASDVPVGKSPITYLLKDSDENDDDDGDKDDGERDPDGAVASTSGAGQKKSFKDRLLFGTIGENVIKSLMLRLQYVYLGGDLDPNSQTEAGRTNNKLRARLLESCAAFLEKWPKEDESE